MPINEKIILGCFGSHWKEIDTFVLKVSTFHVWNKTSLSQSKDIIFYYFIYIDYKINWSELSREKSPLWSLSKCWHLDLHLHMCLWHRKFITQKRHYKGILMKIQNWLCSQTQDIAPSHNDQPSFPHSPHPFSAFLFSHVCSSPKHLHPSFSTSVSLHKHSLVSNPKMFFPPSHNASHPPKKWHLQSFIL